MWCVIAVTVWLWCVMNWITGIKWVMTWSVVMFFCNTIMLWCSGGDVVCCEMLCYVVWWYQILHIISNFKVVAFSIYFYLFCLCHCIYLSFGISPLRPRRQPDNLLNSDNIFSYHGAASDVCIITVSSVCCQEGCDAAWQETHTHTHTHGHTSQVCEGGRQNSCVCRSCERVQASLT